MHDHKHYIPLHADQLIQDPRIMGQLVIRMGILSLMELEWFCRRSGPGSSKPSDYQDQTKVINRTQGFMCARMLIRSECHDICGHIHTHHIYVFICIYTITCTQNYVYNIYLITQFQSLILTVTLPYFAFSFTYNVKLSNLQDLDFFKPSNLKIIQYKPWNNLESLGIRWSSVRSG